MKCAAAPYPTEGEALLGKQAILDRLQLYGSLQHCEACDAYHVIVDFRDRLGRKLPQHMQPSPRIIELLELVAMGFQNSEVAAIMGLAVRTVEHYIDRAIRRLYAKDRTHLVAIAIAHGLIDPRKFIPDIKERQQA